MRSSVISLSTIVQKGVRDKQVKLKKTYALRIKKQFRQQRNCIEFKRGRDKGQAYKKIVVLVVVVVVVVVIVIVVVGIRY